MSIITLLTDFGAQDGYVGAVKGVILSINPKVTLVDITHEIPSFGIEEAAFVLNTSYSYFPKGTVHLTVVDPGVGGKRRPIVVQTPKYFFVGPDNGILSYVLESEKILKVIQIDDPNYWIHPVSSTFHARDIFGPVAAHLTRGVPLSKLGSWIARPERLKFPQPVRNKKGVKGHVVYRDKFGNFVTNISRKHLKASELKQARVHVAGRVIDGITSHYMEVPKGQLAALFSSTGHLEIAVREGDASQRVRIDKGTDVRLEF